MARKNIRTDEHRPGAIVPANYQVAVSYSYGASYGWDLGMPVVRMHEMCAAALGQKVYGQAGKCGVCGARYAYGDLWIHMSGDLVHVGHECSEKYLGWVDRTEWQLAHERELAKHKVLRARDRAAAKRAEFLAANPGLADALALDHPIVRDIARRYEQKGTISQAQIDLVYKLIRERVARETKRAAIAAEAHVPAPTGRQTFVGKIVSVKARDGYRGGVEWKATIVVPGAAGSWTAWCTVPADVLRAEVGSLYANREQELRDALVGRTVEVTATLERGRDEHFAFAKRPVWRVLDDGQFPVAAPHVVTKKEREEFARTLLGTEWSIEICDVLFPKIQGFVDLWRLGAMADEACGESFALAMAGLS